MADNESHRIWGLAGESKQIGTVTHGTRWLSGWIDWRTARSSLPVVLSIAMLAWMTHFGPSVAGQDFPVKSLWTHPGQDWPRFLGAKIDGASSEKGILKDWSQGKLQELWRIETGEGYGIGVAASGRFFHFGKYQDQAVLKCLNAETGELIWSFKYPSEYRDLYNYDSGPRASPLVDQDRVYTFGVEGMLHCLDVETGKLRWKVDTEKKFGVVQNFFGVGSTPLIHLDKLIVMIGGSPPESQAVAPGNLSRVKPNGAGIVAFNKFTGSVEYQALDDLASYSSLTKMKLGSTEIGLAWLRSSLRGFDLQNGKELFAFPWRARKLESVNASTPMVIGQQVFISESYQKGGALLDLAEGSPKIVWSDQGKRDQAMATHWNTPVVAGDYLYGCSGQHSGSAEIRCVNWKTGKVQWTHRGLGRASLTKIDGHLIVLGESGELLLIKDDPRRFNQVTKYETKAGDSLRLKRPCWAAPVVSHGLLWVRGSNSLVCLKLK